MDFHNGLTYEHQIIIKYFVDYFERQFEYFGKSTGKYLTFSVLIEKQEIEKTIESKIRFFDSVRFMASSLSSLIDNLSEALREGKCKDCK